MLSDLLQDKVALITGSTSGIGLATAETLARSGARLVVLNGRSAANGAAALARLRTAVPGARFEFVAADMYDLGQIEALFAKVGELGGGLDIFVHSGYGGGGGSLPDLFCHMSPKASAQTVAGIMLSLIYCCHFAVPMLRARGGGAIVGVASDAAKVPTPGEAVHGGALAGSVMFLRTLAREVGRDGIRINSVTPSLVKDTRNYELVMGSDYSRQLFQKIEKRAQLGLPGPQDLAHLIAFLVSPLAAHITGQVVSCNGGISGA